MSSVKTERELLAEISGKLDQLVAVVSIQGKDRDTQIETLYALDFDSATIGRLVGLTPSAVRKWRFNRKKAGDR